MVSQSKDFAKMMNMMNIHPKLQLLFFVGDPSRNPPTLQTFPGRKKGNLRSFNPASSNPEAAEEKIREINDAYETLSNPLGKPGWKRLQWKHFTLTQEGSIEK